MEREALARKIRDVLQKVCPAFEWIGEGAAIWHGCKCKAQTGDNFCTCVWHTTSVCLAGQWSQLDFINKLQDEEVAVAVKYLEQAEAAIAATTSPD